MFEFQPFLSLNEAIELSKEFDLDLKEKDILFLSSLGKFRAFNHISLIKYSNKGKPVYKIKGVKYLYEPAFPTRVSDLINQLGELTKNPNILLKRESEEFDLLTFKCKQSDDALTANFSRNENNLLLSIDFKHCRIVPPFFWGNEDELDRNEKYYDKVTGMLESTMIEAEALSRKSNNANLFLEHLKERIESISRPMWSFKINSMVKYNLLLESYELETEDRYDDELMEVDRESDLYDVFFFKTSELIAFFREVSNKEDISILEAELINLQAENTKLKAQIEQLEQNIEKANEQEHHSKDYIGDIPLNTNEEKLAYFINLLIEASPELQKDGRKPTYSELHTILQTKLRNKKIPSKATIQKYMNQI
ncbi:hypothetical protein [Avibacterium avium]|uniref:hypothetical protein n=1 Tax=Avibacterium avium TaxID=751 RepID=UPI003BF7F30F